MTFKAVTCSRNFPVRVNFPIFTQKGIFHLIRNCSYFLFFFPIFAPWFFGFCEFHLHFFVLLRTQACPHRKQILARDARGQVGEVLGAVVDSVLVAEAEAHACGGGVAGGGGV